MIILGTNSIKDTGYDVANSIRLDGSSAYLNKSNGSSTGRVWSFSCWLKISDPNDGNMNIFNVSSDANNTTYVEVATKSGSGLEIQIRNGTSGDNGTYLKRTSNAVLRDVSSWYNIIVIFDSTNGTADDRLKIFLNGERITSFASTAGVVPENYVTQIGVNNAAVEIGRNTSGAHYVDGYLAEVVLVDGTAQATTDFGEFDEDSGIWKPIDVSGLTAGTNGFYLDFEASGNLGNDAFGGTDFTENNIAAIDQSTDTCTNNFATMNPLAYRLDSGVSLPTYSEGNTVVSYANDSGAGKSTMATIGFQNGKWYWEYKVGTANDTIFGGITRMDYDPNDNFAGRSCYYNKTGAFSVGTGTGGTADGSYGNSYTTDDIIGVAFDCDNGVIWFSKNGTWQNSATIAEIGAGTTTNSATTGITLNQFWSPFFEGANGGISANFGSPAYAISSGNTDGDGYGNFEYAVPSGYFAINTKNLAEYG